MKSQAVLVKESGEIKIIVKVVEILNVPALNIKQLEIFE